MRTSVENEWLCAQILKAYGIPVANCEIRTFGKTKALVVERFDRVLHASRKYWLRLPQEDFCQATDPRREARRIGRRAHAIWEPERAIARCLAVPSSRGRPHFLRYERVDQDLLVV